MSGHPRRLPGAPAAPAAEQDELAQGAMPFRAHLTELRQRMLRAIIGVGLGFFVAWSFHVELFDLLSAPIRAAMANNGLFAIKALQITESITVYMRLSLVAGLFLASPWVFWQLWSFVAPGLLRSEKRLAVPVLSASVFFFFAGAAFCYFVVLPFMTDFLIKMTIEADGLTLEPTLASTTSFAMWLLLAFGLVFELPVFMYFLSVLELVTARGLLAFYRYWVVIAAIIGAILTPTPDPLNQLLMSGPLVVLYGVGIGIAYFVELDRRQGRAIPTRGALALVALVVLAGWVGVRTTGQGSADALADVPRETLQVIGVHLPAAERLLQLATDGGGAQGLGPVALLGALGAAPIDAHALVVRMADGVAVIARVKDAAALPERVASAHRSSRLVQAGGPSATFRIPGDERLWRITAPHPELIWIGHDRALAALAAVRSGARPGLAHDTQLVEAIAQARASGPLWAVSGHGNGIGGWLPAGAMADRLQRAVAVVGKDAAWLEFQLGARSEADARSIADRLAVWQADTRRVAAEAATAPTDERLELVARRLSVVAGLLARVGETAARALPEGSTEAVTLLAASNDAHRLSRELRTPPAAPAPKPSVDALAGLVLPPQVAELRQRGSMLTWRIEGQPGPLLAALMAPALAGMRPGLAPAIVAALPPAAAAPTATAPASEPATDAPGAGPASDQPAAPAEAAPEAAGRRANPFAPTPMLAR